MGEAKNEMEMFERSETTIKRRVESLLEQYPKLRDDDRALLQAYYRRYTGVRLSERMVNALFFAPSPETIFRRRRELQNEREELRGSFGNERKRGKLAFIYKEHFRQLTIREI